MHKCCCPRVGELSLLDMVILTSEVGVHPARGAEPKAQMDAYWTHFLSDGKFEKGKLDSSEMSLAMISFCKLKLYFNIFKQSY